MRGNKITSRGHLAAARVAGEGGRREDTVYREKLACLFRTMENNRSIVFHCLFIVSIVPNKYTNLRRQTGASCPFTVWLVSDLSD